MKENNVKISNIMGKIKRYTGNNEDGSKYNSITFSGFISSTKLLPILQLAKTNGVGFYLNCNGGISFYY